MERDQFLTEAMGELRENPYTRDLIFYDFSIWANFGKLWEWAQEQDWWADFIEQHSFNTSDWKIVQPDRFADAVYAFLKGE